MEVYPCIGYHLFVYYVSLLVKFLVYRHPTDEQPPVEPWSPTVLNIKLELEAKLGVVFNHALIQWYRYVIYSDTIL